MKILVCYPGPRFSVFDVANYYARAFEDIGCQVERFNFHNNLVYHEGAFKLFSQKYTGKKVDRQAILTLAANDLISCVARAVPDVVLVVGGLTLPPELFGWLNEMRRSWLKPFRIVAILTESPYLDKEQDLVAKNVQLAFVTEKNSVDRFAKIVETHYLTHAYMPQVHKPVKDDDYSSDVYLVGTGFPERQRLLEEVDWSGIDFKLDGTWLEIDERLEPYARNGFVPNAEAAKWYSNAKISLNIFRRSRNYKDEAGWIKEGDAVSLSPRIYEILACGGFLLTDYRPELEIFDGCYGVFDDDLGEQVRRWLRGDRSERVRKGLEVVKPYTYQANAERILGILRG